MATATNTTTKGYTMATATASTDTRTPASMRDRIAAWAKRTNTRYGRQVVSFGYIGNVERNGTDNRGWTVWVLGVHGPYVPTDAPVQDWRTLQRVANGMVSVLEHVGHITRVQ